MALRESMGGERASSGAVGGFPSIAGRNQADSGFKLRLPCWGSFVNYVITFGGDITPK